MVALSGVCAFRALRMPLWTVRGAVRETFGVKVLSTQRRTRGWARQWVVLIVLTSPISVRHSVDDFVYLLSY